MFIPNSKLHKNILVSCVDQLDETQLLEEDKICLEITLKTTIFPDRTSKLFIDNCVFCSSQFDFGREKSKQFICFRFVSMAIRVAVINHYSVTMVTTVNFSLLMLWNIK